MKPQAHVMAITLAVALSSSGCGNSFYSPSGHEARIREKERMLGRRNWELANIKGDLSGKRAKSNTLNSRIRANEADIARLRALPSPPETNVAELERLNQEGVRLRADLSATQERISHLEFEQTRLRKELLYSPPQN